MTDKIKVIFLDFDGVLNNAAYRAAAEDYFYDFIDETKMPFLKQISDATGAVIVLTTTWRMYWDEFETKIFPETTAAINGIFEKYGMKIYSKTDFYDDHRDFEISMWLCENNVENYVILDDIDFRWSEENRRHFVKTDDKASGLDDETVKRAIEILNGKN